MSAAKPKRLQLGLGSISVAANVLLLWLLAGHVDLQRRAIPPQPSGTIDSAAIVENALGLQSSQAPNKPIQPSEERDSDTLMVPWQIAALDIPKPVIKADLTLSEIVCEVLGVSSIQRTAIEGAMITSREALEVLERESAILVTTPDEQFIEIQAGSDEQFEVLRRLASTIRDIMPINGSGMVELLLNDSQLEVVSAPVELSVVQESKSGENSDGSNDNMGFSTEASRRYAHLVENSGSLRQERRAE